MAVCFGRYDDAGKVEYVGRVLDKYECNGYEDSDFYVSVWDDATNSILELEYDTTRFATNGSWAEIDADRETLKKAFEFHYAECEKKFDEFINADNAKKFCKGDVVRVVRGRKVKKGSTGEVFWIGSCYNHFTYKNEMRVGMHVGDEAVFLPAEYVECANWGEKLLTGEKRETYIKKMAMELMPWWFQKRCA